MISKVSSGGVSRDVTFNLRVNGDGLKQLLRDVKDAEMKFRDLGPKANATRQQTEAYQKMGKAIKDAASEVDKLAKAEVKKREAIEAELKKQIAAVDKAYAARRTAEEKAAARDEAAFAKSLAKKNAEEQKATAAAIREQEKVTKALERESAKRAAIQQRETQSFIAAKQREAAAAQSLSGRGPFGSNEAMFRTGRGILDVGRGLALSGLVGEQDASKLLDTLLKIEATYSGVKGGIEAYQGLSGAVQNYVEAVRAAKVAEEALQAVRLAKGGWNISSLASTAAAGGGGGAAALGTAGGGTAAGAGGSLALGTAGSAAIIVTGLVMSLITLKEHLDGTAQAAEGMTGALMRFYAPFTDWLASVGAFGDNGNKRTSEMVKQRDFNRIAFDASKQYQEAMDIARDEATGKRWARIIGSIMEDYAARSFGMNNDDKLLENRSAQVKMMQERSGFVSLTKYGGSQQNRLDAERTAIDASRKIVTLMQEELAIVQEIADKSVAGSRERLKLLEDQKKIQHEMAEEAKNRYMSGKERFGNMTQTEQQRLIEVQRAFKMADQLDRSGYYFKQQQAKAIRASIPVEDRQKLASLGLSEGNAYNSRAAIENANRNSFDDYFGGAETRQFKKATAREAAVDVNIKNENQLVVNVQSNIESLITRIKTEMAAANAASNAQLLREVEARFEKQSEMENKRRIEETNSKQMQFQKKNASF